MSKDLIGLRNLIRKVIDEIADENGQAPTPRVLETLRSQFPAIVRACSVKLEDIALKKLVSDVGRRVCDPCRDHPQPDLFSGFHGTPRPSSYATKVPQPCVSCFQRLPSVNWIPGSQESAG